MHYYDPSIASTSQFALATDTINSAAKTFIDVHGLKITVKSSQVPTSLPLQLNTNDLGYFIPGLKEKYGAGIPVDLQL